MKSIISLCFVFLAFTTIAQSKLNGLYPNNNLYLSGGIGGGTVNYSVKIKEKDEKRFSSQYIRIGAGAGSVGIGTHFFLGFAYEWVFGKGMHHFEMGYGLGVMYTPRSPEPWFPVPMASWGYRYQKPNGWFFLRTGLGLPELPYLGFGIAF